VPPHRADDRADHRDLPPDAAAHAADNGDDLPQHCVNHAANIGSDDHCHNDDKTGNINGKTVHIHNGGGNIDDGSHVYDGGHGTDHRKPLFAAGGHKHHCRFHHKNDDHHGFHAYPRPQHRR
jgi:hypothetical protein